MERVPIEPGRAHSRPVSPTSAPDESLSSSQSWFQFLTSYAQGQHAACPPTAPGSSSTARASPSSSRSVSPASQPSAPGVPSLGSDFDNPVYSSVEITPTIARQVRDFYRRHSFLPPPRAPLEFLREQCIQEYDLYSQKQTENVKVATDLMLAFFGGIVTFTLFKHSQQELIAISGPQDVVESIGLYVGQRLLPETSLCGHSILSPKENIFIPDLARDWRYTGNPYADELKGIKSYIGSVVSLHVDPASPEEERTVPVGVFNVMRLDRHFPPPTPEQSKVIRHITTMLETQLQATWEGHNRTREAQTRRVLSEYLEETLVQPTEKQGPAEGNFGVTDSPDTTAMSNPFDEAIAARSGASSSARKQSTAGTSSFATAGRKQSTVGTEEALQGMGEMEYCAHLGARRIMSVLSEVDAVAVLDMRGLHVTGNVGSDDFAPSFNADSPFGVLGWHCADPKTAKPKLDPAKVSSCLLHLLQIYARRRPFTFDEETGPSGLEPHLPPSSCKHICIPLYAEDGPLIAIVASTSRPFFAFRGGDINFIHSMGVVLRARLVQSRALEADAAKTAFLSSISHELRTPLHGLLSGLDLMRDAANAGDHDEVERLLSVAESSGQSLELILNDVLDFGTWTRGGEVVSRWVRRDLAEVVLATARISVPRMLSLGDGAVVDMEVQIEDRDWAAEIDEVGVQRILLNGLTNAIKFTKAGRIAVKLSSSPSGNGFIIEVQDQGPGVSPAFAQKAFEPFTKADSFMPGAGLGLHISRLLAERMGGTISLSSVAPPKRGALFRVELPGGLLASRRPKTDGNGVRKRNGIGEAAFVTHRIGSSISATSMSREGSRTSQRRHPERLSFGPASSSSPSAPTHFLSAIDPVDRSPDPISSVQASLRSLTLNAAIKREPLSPPLGSPLRVLVVEDNEINRKILVTLLNRLALDDPLEIAQARDGVEGVEVFEDFKPHLVLTDVSMPRMDGVAAAAEMRRIERDWGLREADEGDDGSHVNGNGNGASGGRGGKGKEGNSDEPSQQRASIFAITGLGSSDPRLKVESLRGGASLDGWLIKGQDKLPRIKEIVGEVRRRLRAD